MDALSTLGLNSPGFISQIVNFVAIMLLLTRLLYNPVRNSLIQRRERIAEGIRDADRARAAAAEAEQEKENILMAARDESQQIRARATRDADQAAQQIRARAEEEAAAIRQQAQQEAEEQKSTVLADAQRQIAELAMLGAERILGRELEQPVDQEQLIAELMSDNNRS